MKAFELYQRLEEDFELGVCKDNWSEMHFNAFITDNFKTRYMGLVADNTETVAHVFTAVFPSRAVIDKMIASGVTYAMLFTHHPMAWDMSKTPVFSDMGNQEYQALRDHRISMYTLHSPLDKNGVYSTSMNLADRLGVLFESDICQYHGQDIGLIGKTHCAGIDELQDQLESVLGHPVVRYQNASDEIRQGRIGIVAGGGNMEEVYEELHLHGVNTFVTGIANMRSGYAPAIKGHETAKRHGINILAGTHYSTEKFACIRMVEYFNKLGLSAEFVEDRPDMADM